MKDYKKGHKIYLTTKELKGLKVVVANAGYKGKGAISHFLSELSSCDSVFLVKKVQGKV